MRLLFDEHYTATIALQLRSRGHDAVAVQERRELAGLSDRDLLKHAIDHQRALVTEDVRHFVRLAHEFALTGERHYGIVFTSPRSMPRSLGTLGLFVVELERLLRDHAEDDALVDRVHWLGAG